MTQVPQGLTDAQRKRIVDDLLGNPRFPAAQEPFQAPRENLLGQIVRDPLSGMFRVRQEIGEAGGWVKENIASPMLESVVAPTFQWYYEGVQEPFMRFTLSGIPAHHKDFGDDPITGEQYFDSVWSAIRDYYPQLPAKAPETLRRGGALTAEFAVDPLLALGASPIAKGAKALGKQVQLARQAEFVFDQAARGVQGIRGARKFKGGKVPGAYGGALREGKRVRKKARLTKTAMRQERALAEGILAVKDRLKEGKISADEALRHVKGIVNKSTYMTAAEKRGTLQAFDFLKQSGLGKLKPKHFKEAIQHTYSSGQYTIGVSSEMLTRSPVSRTILGTTPWGRRLMARMEGRAWSLPGGMDPVVGLSKTMKRFGQMIGLVGEGKFVKPATIGDMFLNPKALSKFGEVLSNPRHPYAKAWKRMMDKAGPAELEGIFGKKWAAELEKGFKSMAAPDQLRAMSEALPDRIAGWHDLRKLDIAETTKFQEFDRQIDHVQKILGRDKADLVRLSKEERVRYQKNLRHLQEQRQLARNSPAWEEHFERFPFDRRDIGHPDVRFTTSDRLAKPDEIKKYPHLIHRDKYGKVRIRDVKAEVPTPASVHYHPTWSFERAMEWIARGLAKGTGRHDAMTRWAKGMADVHVARLGVIPGATKTTTKEGLLTRWSRAIKRNVWGEVVSPELNSIKLQLQSIGALHSEEALTQLMAMKAAFLKLGKKEQKFIQDALELDKSFIRGGEKQPLAGGEGLVRRANILGRRAMEILTRERVPVKAKYSNFFSGHALAGMPDIDAMVGAQVHRNLRREWEYHLWKGEAAGKGQKGLFQGGARAEFKEAREQWAKDNPLLVSEKKFQEWVHTRLEKDLPKGVAPIGVGAMHHEGRAMYQRATKNAMAQVRSDYWRAVNKTVDDAEDVLVRRLTPEARAFYDHAKKQQAAYAREEVEQGIRTLPGQYFPHTLTVGNKKYLYKSLSEQKPGMVGRYDLDDFARLPTEEINKMLAKGGMSVHDFDKLTGDPKLLKAFWDDNPRLAAWFEVDPVNKLAARKMHLIRAETWDGGIKELLRTQGVPLQLRGRGRLGQLNELGMKMAERPGWVPVVARPGGDLKVFHHIDRVLIAYDKAPDAQFFLIPREGAEMVSHTLQSMQSAAAKEILGGGGILGKGRSGITKLWNSQMRWFKGMILVAPDYHFRNAEQGFFANWIGGAGPRDYGSAMDIIRAPDRMIELPLGPVKISDLFDEMRVYGGAHTFTGQIVAPRDLTTMNMDLIDKGLRKPGVGKALRTLDPSDLPIASRAIQINRKVGNWVEWANRFPLYIAARRKGLTPAEAARYVNRFHFDYFRKTPITRFMGQFIPFEAWTRSVMRQAWQSTFGGEWGNVVRYLGGQKALHTLIRGGASGRAASPPRDELKPAWLKRGDVVITDFDEDSGYTEAYTSTGQTYGTELLDIGKDIGDLAMGNKQPFFSNIAGRAAPPITLGLSFMGVNPRFPGKAAQKFSGQPSTFAGFKVPRVPDIHAHVFTGKEGAAWEINRTGWKRDVQDVIDYMASKPGVPLVLNKAFLATYGPFARILNTAMQPEEEMSNREKALAWLGFRKIKFNMYEEIRRENHRIAGEYFGMERDWIGQAYSRAGKRLPKLDFPEDHHYKFRTEEIRKIMVRRFEMMDEDNVPRDFR
jgi:hypothetical protein